MLILSFRQKTNDQDTVVELTVLQIKNSAEIISKDELLKQLSNKYIDYSYVENFCIGLQETRLKSLINMIN